MAKFVPGLPTLLETAWPRIARTEWTQFGVNITTRDKKNGWQKYTGLLLQHTEPPIVAANVVAFGYLPDQSDSAQTVLRKIQILEWNANARTSLELRKPPEYWAGAIRSSRNPEDIYALTGQPEIGDHLILADSMRTCDLLSEDDFTSLTHHSQEQMVHAREHAGMTVPMFMALRGHITSIIADAAAELAAWIPN